MSTPADTTVSRRLFIASCMALVATAMSFAIRGDIMGDFERLFALTKTDVGWISGAAFWGFGFSILIGGPLCDLLGMGMLLRLAAVGHIGGAMPRSPRRISPSSLPPRSSSASPTASSKPPSIRWSRLFMRRQDAPAGRAPRLVPRRHRHRRRVEFPVHPGRTLLAPLAPYTGWQAKMLLLLVPSVSVCVPVRRSAVPADRTRRCRRPVLRHVQGDLSAVVPCHLAVHVAHGGDRARSGPMGEQHLQ